MSHVVEEGRSALKFWAYLALRVRRIQRHVPLGLGLALTVCCPVTFALSNDPSSLAKAALVIGNANYAAVGTLKNPINDAQDICQTLRGLAYRVSCFQDVKSRAELRAIIQDFVETLSPTTVGLIYYAGHAVQVNGENYLIPTGAHLQTEASVEDEAVDLGYLMDQLRQTEAYLKIVILDACRNNPLQSSTSSLAQGLAQITDIPNETFVLYATAANDVALDGEGRNGILTKNILAHIHDEGDLDDLVKQVSQGVQRDTGALGHIQTPSWHSNFDGRYCFVKCTKAEELQAQKEEAAHKVAELQARLDAGDPQVKSELAAAKAELKRKDQEQAAAARAAAKKAKDNQDKAFVPIAF